MDLGKVGFVLDGGGCKCAFEAGVLRGLEKRGVKPKLVQGVSAGALTGAKFVEAGAEPLVKIWLELEQKGYSAVFPRMAMARHIWWSNALYGDAGLNWLVSFLDPKKLVESPIDFEVVVFNEVKEELEIFSNRLIQANGWDPKIFPRIIKASASLSGGFAPEFINGELYSDGCRMSLESFWDCDTVFILNPDQPHETINPQQLANMYWYKRMLKKMSGVIDACMELEIARFAQVHNFKIFNPESSRGGILKKLVRILEEIAGTLSKKIIIVSPSTNISSLMLDYFRKGDLSFAVDHGEKVINEILDKLGV